MFKKLTDGLLSLSGRLWRPVGLWSIVGGVLVNCIVLPLWKGTGVDLASFGLLIASFAPLAAIRTYEKLQDPDDPLGSVPKPDPEAVVEPEVKDTKTLSKG